MRRPVVLVPYCSDWPALFLQARAELAGVFAGLTVAIEHVGSTAVPGLAAKPIVDLLLGAPSLADIEVRIDAIAALGYEYIPRYEIELPMRRFFKRVAPRSCHLHAVAFGSAFWREQLAFRDALRGDPALAGQYRELKYRLAASFHDDAERYTSARVPLSGES